MALRETIDTYHHNGAKIALGTDTGGPVGGDHVVSIASGELRSDSDDGGWFVNRWFFFDEWSEQYARNFAEKIATDEEYRSQSLAGDATWKQSRMHTKRLQERCMGNSSLGTCCRMRLAIRMRNVRLERQLVKWNRSVNRSFTDSSSACVIQVASMKVNQLVSTGSNG